MKSVLFTALTVHMFTTQEELIVIAEQWNIFPWSKQPLISI